jgi:hypothetical protein
MRAAHPETDLAGRCPERQLKPRSRKQRTSHDRVAPALPLQAWSGSADGRSRNLTARGDVRSGCLAPAPDGVSVRNAKRTTSRAREIGDEQVAIVVASCPWFRVGAGRGLSIDMAESATALVGPASFCRCLGRR